MVHSVPARPADAGCASGGRRAHPRLRGAVLGYGGFRSGSGVAVAHRLLPLACATLVVDVTAPDAVVTGARHTATAKGHTTWGTGVSIGLSPAGVSALLGVPMGELAGATLRLTDVLGARAAELTGRLAGQPGWAARFALLDDLLTGWLGDRHPPDPVVTAAWHRLQQPQPPTAGALAADRGISRRRLERAFRQQVGLLPGAVARVARFQRAVRLCGTGAALATVAADAGYAHQSHLSRETRAMAGVTPAQLRAIVQYRPLVPA